ncbi:hypothetical protein BGZ83_007147 [Gryganskiella cystojenkinii]|nr:hypothetical protein BGZ83_007147 [Gryganskiella cystojenkinii]
MKTERSLPRKDITGKGKGRAINQDLDTSMDWKEDSGGHRYAYGSDNGGNDEEPLKRNSIAHRMRLQEQEQQHRIQSAKDRPRFGGLMTLTADVEALLRAMLLKISVSRADLPLTSSDEELSFTVVVETKIESSGPEAKPDFPWSPISASVLAEQTKISPQPATPSPHRKIIPVKTIDISSIQV